MRISTLERDPGFSPDAKRAKVTLNGVEIKTFMTADEEGGFVRLSMIDVRRGVVEITMPSAQEKSSGFRKLSPFERRDAK